jgi:hypothetical protein
MIKSLSSTITSPFQYVYPGQGDFTENPRLGLVSLLTCYGVKKADEFVEALVDYVKGDFFALLTLISLLEGPGLTQLCACIKLALGIPYKKVKQELTDLLPNDLAIDYTETLDKISDVNSLVSVLAYFGYPNIIVNDLLDHRRFLASLAVLEPGVAEELTALLNDDLLFFLLKFIARITKTDLLRSKLATKKLSSYLSRSLALGALGQDIQQDSYFVYVSALQASS